MAMEIDGATDEMQKFNPIPPASVTATNGASAGGGMPEGAAFAEAEAAAAQELAKFVTDVRTGFAAFANAVAGAAAEYLRGDATGADSIARSAQALPPMFQGGR